MKKCTKCGEEKERSEFYFKNKARGLLQPVCKICTKMQNKKYFSENMERLHKKNKEYREKNREHLNQKNREYYKENQERLVEQAREYRKDNKKKVALNRKKRRIKNHEKILAQEKGSRERRKDKQREYMRKYVRTRRREDPVFKLRHNVSRMINFGLLNQNATKDNSVWSVLPYSPKELKKHLEAQFDENMTWENYGDYWHVDHVYPQSELIYDSLEHENFQKCWALKNLQPLEAGENIQKSNKILINESAIAH